MTNNHSNDFLSAGSGDVAVIGEGATRTSVSLQLLQEIYHELTGKSEDVSNYYNEAFHVVHSDFEQLHHRIGQACEQYNICANTYSIKAYYINDTQDTFSSIERFRLFNAGSTSSVESVFLTYNFLILLPKLHQPQSYTLSIRIASRIAIEKKMRHDIPFNFPKILRVMGGRTAVVTVKYIDYVVARNLLNVVDEWFNTLSQERPSKYWKFIQRRSEKIPLITRYLAAFVITLLILVNLPSFVSSNATLLEFARFWLCASAGLFAAYKLAHHIGSAAETSFDKWSELSYISLTSGDKKEIQEAEARNKSSIRVGCITFVSALLVSALAKLIIYFVVGP